MGAAATCPGCGKAENNDNRIKVKKDVLEYKMKPNLRPNI